MTNEPFDLASLIDELRVQILRNGMISYQAPDPATAAVLAELDLPPNVVLVVTEMIVDGQPDLPKQDLASVLARLFARTLGVG